jgi:hypothetical protein
VRKITLLAVTALTVVAPATQAKADVVQVPRSATVVVSGPSTIVDLGTVRTTRSSTVIVAWNALGPVLVRRASSSGTTRLRERVSSAWLTPGTSRWEVEDDTDSRVLGLSVSVLRRSKVVAPTLIRSGPRTVLVSGVSKHYDIKTGGYTGDSLSPVLIQVYKAKTWRTVKTATTTTKGIFATRIPVTRGVTTVRIVRPVGYVGGVTGGTSPSRFIRIK